MYRDQAYFFFLKCRREEALNLAEYELKAYQESLEGERRRVCEYEVELENLWQSCENDFLLREQNLKEESLILSKEQSRVNTVASDLVSKIFSSISIINLLMVLCLIIIFSLPNKFAHHLFFSRKKDKSSAG